MVAELFLRTLVKMYGKHMVYTDEGVWYPDVCKSLGLEHRMHTCILHTRKAWWRG